MTTVIEQTSAERLNWTIDWSIRGLGTDTIATSVWEGSSTDFTISNTSTTPTTATMYLTGGIPGQAYTITNTVTTASGFIMQETFSYFCIPFRFL